ncbi:mitochondrial calcium uniporter regulator 1-like [Macaca thibetana thibetana]|uniref:mitochondrial calcium uniporter regulator 1-like n=1 Tax=Macaca thibetana thibetana TaxID=257877 RepID=UPI0021BC6A67|nr:mitochondrial calcium uniporter regulator 1-like [Macaca thibetana thibetana]
MDVPVGPYPGHRRCCQRPSPVPRRGAHTPFLQGSAGYLQLERKRRDFTSSGSGKLYFDTHALVCLLEDNGFATQQAEIIVSALVKVLETNMGIVYKDMATKMQQEIALQPIMSQTECGKGYDYLGEV